MIRYLRMNDPVKPNTINVTSRSRDWGRNLSPFLLGPVQLYNNMFSWNVENAWQYSKVYKEHLDENGYITDAYMAWAKNGWSDTRANRYPMGKGIKPEFSFWAGKKLTYTEARREIYIPLYSAAARKSQWYALLEKTLQIHGDIYIQDFDVYDRGNFMWNALSWDDMINNPNKKFGHGFVLGMMLEGVI